MGTASRAGRLGTKVSDGFCPVRGGNNLLGGKGLAAAALASPHNGPALKESLHPFALIPFPEELAIQRSDDE